MPRDLQSLAKEHVKSEMSPLDHNQQDHSKEKSTHDAHDEAPQQHQEEEEPEQQGTMFANTPREQSNPERDDLHPYTQTLTLSDVDSCTILEEAAFPPQERATKAKVSPSSIQSLVQTPAAATCSVTSPQVTTSIILHALALSFLD